MYKIKQIPQDFIVREITDIETKDSGEFAIFKLKKTNYTTLRAIQTIAKALNLPSKQIGFAGTKDKLAVTQQLISIKTNNIEKTKNLNLKDIELNHIGFLNKPLSLGDLVGNEFIITIRNLDSKNQFKPKDKFLNLFGPQRFSKNNEIVGKAIVKKQFKEAVNLILENERDYKEQIETELKNNPNNAVGALLKIPRKIIMMYIHSYQSDLWNKAAIKLKNKQNTNLPIIGFGTDIDEIKDLKIREIIEQTLKEEKLQQRDFIIRQLQNLSQEGTTRPLFEEIKNLKIIEKTQDDLNKDKKKITISFKLNKGSYATVALKEMLEN